MNVATLNLEAAPRAAVARPPTARLAIEDAFWIWTEDQPEAPHVWMFARKRIDVSDPADARIEITADLRYFLWINGRPVGFGPPKFHWETPTVDRYEIGAWLKPGKNTIVVRVYSHGAGLPISSCMPKRGALRAVLEVDGRHIPTDHSWEVRRENAYAAETVARGEFQPPAELFDARLASSSPWSETPEGAEWQLATELDEMAPAARFELRDIPLFGWTTHGFDRVVEKGTAVFPAPLVREDMRNAVAGVTSAVRLVSRDGFTEVRRGLGGAGDQVALNASSLPLTEGAYGIWDLGRVWTGYPVITLRGTPGAVVDLSYGECLTRGHVDPSKHGLNYLDRVVLGPKRLTHHITWPKCLRYLQVDVRGGDVVVESLVLERSAYPVERNGTFSCSDPVLEQAWELGAHTVELCMEDTYMDTPWRERGSWLGDDIFKIVANYSVFGGHALTRRFLLHQVRGQLPTGQMQGKYPASVPSRISTWTLTFPVSVKEYLCQSHDLAFAREILPHVERAVAWMENYRLPEGVFGELPLDVTEHTNIYNFIDWAPVDTSGANAAWNAHAYVCLCSAAFVARQAGDEAKAEIWEKRAEDLRAAFLHLFWDEKKGVFVNGWRRGKRLGRWGAQENYLAIVTGLADETRKKRLVARMKEEDLFAVFIPNHKDFEQIIPGSDGNHMVAIALNQYSWDESKMVPLGTPYFAGFALEALLQMGMADEALAMIARNWGEFSRQGATTIWETWDRNDGSLSHAWGCGPTIFLGKYILGVQPVEDSDVDVEIIPQSGGLEWARGRVNTVRGVIQVNWERREKGWRMEVDAPAVCRLRAGLPAGQKGGELLLNGKPVSGTSTIRRFENDYLSVKLPGGRFVLELAEASDASPQAEAAAGPGSVRKIGTGHAE